GQDHEGRARQENHHQGGPEGRSESVREGARQGRGEEAGREGCEARRRQHGEPEAARRWPRRRARDAEAADGGLAERAGRYLRRPPQEGHQDPHERPRHLPGARTAGASGPQPRHGRADPDQGQQEDRLPPRQGAEGLDL
ncbi:MAG: DNA-binding protein HBsu, partial [uncultured Acetobacteraceae bacterium]